MICAIQGHGVHIIRGEDYMKLNKVLNPPVEQNEIIVINQDSLIDSKT